LQDKRHDELRYRSEKERKRVLETRGSFFDGTGGLQTMTPNQFRLKCYMAGYFLNDEELDEAFRELDKTERGVVVFADYLRWRQREDRFAYFQQHDSEYANYSRQIAEFFRQYDTSLTGYLSREQFAELYEALVEAGEVTAPLEEAFNDIDTDCEGIVQLHAFVAWYSWPDTSDDDA